MATPQGKKFVRLPGVALNSVRAKNGEHRSYRLCFALSKGKAFLVLMKIDLFGSYLAAQATFPKKARELQLAITISREVGAGGRTIAELVAQRLTRPKRSQTPARGLSLTPTWPSRF